MFDNLLGQDEIVARLSADLGASTLPPSLLFAGPPASGKLTTALELARVLSCDRGPLAGKGLDAPWACSCPSCTRHRVLAHPDLLLLGPRSFPEEIGAALDLLARSPGKASAYFFVRALRKLAKRFDAPLYEGEESRLAKAAPFVREIEERLEAIAPERIEPGTHSTELTEAAGAAAAAARKLEALVPAAPPIFQIRALETWAHLAPNGRKKTIVIENADRMADAARNALLKILEEPPPSVEFVLLSARRSALIATILSRVRPYTFAPRSAAAQGLVLERVFRLGSSSWEHGVPDIAAHLRSRRPFPPAAARKAAAGFLMAALEVRAGRTALGPALEAFRLRLAAETTDGEGARSLDGALAALLEATKDFGQRDDAFADSFESFLAAFAELLGEALREICLSATELELVGSWARAAREARSRRETYNLSPTLLAEGLLYGMAGS